MIVPVYNWGWLHQTAPDCSLWMPIKGSNTRVHSVYCYHYATLAVNNDDDSNWEWLRDHLSAYTMHSHCFFLVFVTFWQTIHCSLQKPTRNACCGRETAGCRCKIRYQYVPKCTVASRNSPCISTVLVYLSKISGVGTHKKLPTHEEPKCQVSKDWIFVWNCSHEDNTAMSASTYVSAVSSIVGRALAKNKNWSISCSSPCKTHLHILRD